MLDIKIERISENPLKYKNCYIPKRHEKQIIAHESNKLIRVLFWGNRVGKTEWGGMETAYMVTGTHPCRPKMIPPIDAWVGCPSFELQPDGVQEKLERYIPKQEIADIDKLRGKIWKTLYLKNGSKISFKSYEQGREKWQSAGKDVIWFDEEPPSDIWQEAMMRQEAGRDLNIMLTMTAIKGMTWVYDDIYMDTSDPDLFISTAGWADNPYITPDQMEKMERRVKDPNMLRVRKYGEFIRRVGLVCSWWRREKHMRSYTEFPSDWSYYEVLDPGWSDPCAWLLIGIDGDGDIHVMDGFREKELTEEQIKEKRDSKSFGLIIRGGVSDNDQPRMIDSLYKLGMKLRPVSKKSGESGSWDETLSIKLSEYGTIQKGTGKPRLYVSDKLSWLIGEIETLVWLLQDSKLGQETKPQWDDHRRAGHHFDGMRALCYFLIEYNKPIEPMTATEVEVNDDPYA